ncbi:uncharacterized protein LOC111620279 [Centruroides sculpturatus]|uniref:uncharacterized protein LOC111620279 n=1 Tax=Centruroides sculpturatus TaxID=218467 RepID=UPI000C6D5373|nr:uncharacterized protein LOC111620279 [Centruroides sculpturatus]
MATIEQIEQHRGGRGVSVINARCQICKRQAWNDYYGNFLCKNCLLFFVQSMKNRETYECFASAMCRFSVKADIRACKFCLLEEMLIIHLDPKKFGINGNTWFLKENVKNLRKIQPKEPINLEAVQEVLLFNKRFKQKSGIFKMWMDFFPPLRKPSVGQLSAYLEKCENRAIAVFFAEESLHLHDVLKIEDRYFDPYKCDVAQIQYLTIKLLEFVRLLNQEVAEFSIPDHLKKSLIYFSGIMDRDLINRELHIKLAEIAVWLRSYRNLAEQLKQEFDVDDYQ